MSRAEAIEQRTTSALLNEFGKWSVDAIECAVAHGDTDNARGLHCRGLTETSARTSRNGEATISTGCVKAGSRWRLDAGQLARR